MLCGSVVIFGSTGMGWGGELASANSSPYACAARYTLPQVSEMALCLQLHRRTLSKEPVLPLQGAEGSSPTPGLSADGSSGRRVGLSSSSGRNSTPWGSWGIAGACPTWGDKAQGKLPMALGPWPLWDTDEEQLETESADAEVEAGEHAETAASPE